MKKNKRLIENYEKYISPLREEYYKNILQQDSNNLPKSILFLINNLSFIISIIIILIGGFTTTSYIISLISILITNIIIKIISKTFNLESTNKYLAEIQKQGYFSIEDYEDKIRKYITGPTGYYQQQLDEIKAKYNINDQTTRKISTIGGDEYYIWSNAKQDKINLLNTKPNKKPSIETIRIANVRYFRVDNERHCLILKTDIKIYHLKPESLPILNEIMKNKRLENIKNFTPDVYINDFELFMHRIKKEMNTNSIYDNERLSNNISKLIISLIFIIISIIIKNIIHSYQFILIIISIIAVFILNNAFKEIISFKIKKTINDEDAIKIINSDPECIDYFNELKYSLGISDQFDKIYTTENVCYLTWAANGYFHIFLNLIYFNVVYMAIKPSDIKYYKVDNKTCEIKLKDKTLVFEKDAASVFAKILPNKDYEWLKGYQNTK